MGISRRKTGGRLARDGAAGTSAGHCRETAEIGGQAAQDGIRQVGARQGAAQGGHAAGGPPTHCRAGRPQPAQAALIPSNSILWRHGQIRAMMVHARMLKRIYDWFIDAADKPYALWILAAVSFAESSFFPLPPDIMLLPMSLARPKRAWFFAGVCTVASVAGGVVGYAIGALLYDSVGQWLIHLYNLGDKVETFRQSYAEWGAVIILLKGLTPIPYKLVTITSGFAGYNIWLFILCSIVARGGRFFVVAVLLNRYGDLIRAELEKRLGLWVAIGAIVLVGGFYIAYRLV